MNELDNHIQEISSAVWHFVDQISEGKVGKPPIQRHAM